MNALWEILRKRANIPAIGDNIPARKTPILPAIGHFVFLLFRWRLENALPNIPKFVIIIGPHTSNWDFIFGIAAVFVLKAKISFMGKHTLFKQPFGSIMRWIGGIPIDRDSSYGMVNTMIDHFKGTDKFILALAPEGTRKKVDQWKSGFYHIATGAGVPILLAGFDYEHKAIRLGPLIYPSGDVDGDMLKMQLVFERIRGKKS